MSRTIRRLPNFLQTKEYDTDFLNRCLRGLVDYHLPKKIKANRYMDDQWGPASKRIVKRSLTRSSRCEAKEQIRKETR